MSKQPTRRMEAVETGLGPFPLLGESQRAKNQIEDWEESRVVRIVVVAIAPMVQSVKLRPGNQPH
nr:MULTISPECIES: hypothetical protein [unclassified Cupriavidus]